MPYTAHERFELEVLFDKIGVEGIVSALAEICYLKEVHARQYWKDRNVASRWRALGSKLERLAPKLDDPHFQ